MTAISVDRPRAAGDILATGFGTTVAMWFVGYLGRLPPARIPSWTLGAAMLVCLALGGYVAGRYGARGWRGGLWSGGVASLLNLLILGSLLSAHGVNELRPSAVIWLPGSLLLGALLGSCGAAIGARSRIRGDAGPVAWSGAFAAVAASATLLLVIVGGLVTSEQAGLAVVDWPNSFGYNMFLYPLSRMTGGIYFEHAHRLFGSLVGLTTIALAIHLHRAEDRSWVRRLAWIAVAVVITQGLLGGLRVTGRFTLSTSRAAMDPSTVLAVVHGVLGQIFFSLLVVIAAATSGGWQKRGPARAVPSAGADRRLTALLVAMLFVQLVLGAIQRHLAEGLMIHITLAVLVLTAVVLISVRLSAARGVDPILGRLGRVLVWLGGIQVSLGFGALAALGSRPDTGPLRSWDVLVRTAHQATGAALLASAVLAAAWVRRVMRAPD